MIEAYPVTLRGAVFGAVARAKVELIDLYRDRWRCFDLFSLCEAAIEVDRRFQAWRHSHILMVRRQIGMRTRGTGGTFGKDYLAGTLGYIFFPELWELRHEIAAAHGAEVVGAG
jgi:tryptophan 2,3-dioxygenase